VKPEEARRGREHRKLTLTALRSFADPSLPGWVRDGAPEDDAVYLLGHVDEWFADQDGDQLKAFTQVVDRRFHLMARGRPTVEAEAMMGCINSGDGDVREIVLRIAAAAAATIVSGAEYRLVPRNEQSRYQWRVEGSLGYRFP
jgi:hypothetical protein